MCGHRSKYRIQNPLRQNYRHTGCLAEYLDLDPEVVHSVVSFTGECTFKTPMPPNVMHSRLGSYIKSFRGRLLSDGEVQATRGGGRTPEGEQVAWVAATKWSLFERGTAPPRCALSAARNWLNGRRAGASTRGRSCTIMRPSRRKSQRIGCRWRLSGRTKEFGSSLRPARNHHVPL